MTAENAVKKVLPNFLRVPIRIETAQVALSELTVRVPGELQQKMGKPPSFAFVRS